MSCGKWVQNARIYVVAGTSNFGCGEEARVKVVSADARPAAHEFGEKS